MKGCAATLSVGRARLVGTPKVARAGRTSVRARASSLYVRPYTVRQGDTLYSICNKRGFEMDEVLALNHGLNADLIVEGQTLLLPAGSLSKRDKEILAGIGSSTYRTYPVRKGEKIQDILGARKVTMEEAQGLNPGMDLNKLAEGQVIKLPPGKYTVREQEMMMGTARAPLEYFSAAGPVALGGLAGAVAGAGAAYLFMKKYVLDNVDGYETEDED